MKKYILGFLLVGVLLVPSLSYAATTQEQHQETLRQLIVMLTQRLNELIAQLQIVQGQNQQIISNNSKVTSTVQTPQITQTPVVAYEELMPTALEFVAYNRGPNDQDFIQGGNCGQNSYYIAVKDQKGNDIKDASVSFNGTDYKTNDVMWNTVDYINRPVARILYRTNATSTMENLVFTSGNAKLEHSLRIDDSMYGYYKNNPQSFFKDINDKTGTQYVFSQDGQTRINVVTGLCL